MIKTKIATTLLLLCTFISLGQTNLNKSNDSTSYINRSIEKNLVFIPGYQSGENQYLELGLGFKKEVLDSIKPTMVIYHLSNELKINKIQNNFVWGQKVGIWFFGGPHKRIALGLNIINYTNFKENSIHVRPEMGINLGITRISFGCNLGVVNKKMEGVNQPRNISINWVFNLKKKKHLKSKNEVSPKTTTKQLL